MYQVAITATMVLEALGTLDVLDVLDAAQRGFDVISVPLHPHTHMDTEKETHRDVYCRNAIIHTLSKFSTREMP